MRSPVFYSLTCLGSFIFLVACKTKQIQSDPPSATSSSLLPLEVTSLESYIPSDKLFSLVATKFGEKTLDVEAEFTAFCEKNIDICGRKAVSNNKNSERFKKHHIVNLLREKKWDEVKTVPLHQMVQSLRNEKGQRLLSLASDIPLDSCELTTARVGLGLLLERELPEPNILEQILNLYGAQLSCPETSDVMRAHLRFSLLRISQNQCALAEPYLKKLESSVDSSFRSRGIFWQRECGQKEKISQNDFPFLSFHGLRALERFQIAPTYGLSNSLTPLARRLSDGDRWNALLSLIEYSILKERMDLSRWMLERIHLETVSQLPGEVQVYIGYLAFLSRAHLRKKQILNSLVTVDSRFHNRTVRDLLFPQLYQEEISAQKSNIPTEMIMALIRQESAFDLRARSRVGATGLMQLMYSTAKILDRRIQRRDLLKPEVNISLGTRYLEKLWKNFDGSAVKALAAYNAGPLKVIEWQKRYPVENELLFAELIPFNETRDYVALVLRNYMIYQQIKLETKNMNLTHFNEEQKSPL